MILAESNSRCNCKWYMTHNFDMWFTVISSNSTLHEFFGFCYLLFTILCHITFELIWQWELLRNDHHHPHNEDHDDDHDDDHDNHHHDHDYDDDHDESFMEIQYHIPNAHFQALWARHSCLQWIISEKFNEMLWLQYLT